MIMDFQWLAPKDFFSLPEKKYINNCCVGGDKILEFFKFDLAAEMKINASEIAIYQEDWGWALEFSKNSVNYLLAISNCEEKVDNRMLFSSYTQVTKKEGNWFSDKSIVFDSELQNFSKIVEKLAAQNGLQNI